MIVTMRLAGIRYMWVLWLFVRNLWIRVVWGWIIISVPFSIFTILLTEIVSITKKVFLPIFFSFFWGTRRIWRIINMRLHTQILNLIIIYICSAKFNQFISLSLYSSWLMLNMKRNVWYIYEINQSKSFISTIVLHVGQFFLVCNQVERHSKWNRCRHANTFIFSCSLKFYIQTEHFYSELYFLFKLVQVINGILSISSMVRLLASTASIYSVYYSSASLFENYWWYTWE